MLTSNFMDPPEIGTVSRVLVKRSTLKLKWIKEAMNTWQFSMGNSQVSVPQ